MIDLGQAESVGPRTILGNVSPNPRLSHSLKRIVGNSSFTETDSVRYGFAPFRKVMIASA